MTRMRVRVKIDEYGQADTWAWEGARDEKPAPVVIPPPVVAVFVLDLFKNADEGRLFTEVRRQVFDRFRIITLSAAKQKDRTDPARRAADIYAIAHLDGVEPPAAYANLPRIRL
jgi:hypothetical protein